MCFSVWELEGREVLESEGRYCRKEESEVRRKGGRKDFGLGKTTFLFLLLRVLGIRKHSPTELHPGWDGPFKEGRTDT